MILFYDEDYYEDDDYDDANHDEDEDDDDCDDDDCDDDLLAGSTRQVPWAQQFCNRGLKPLRAHHWWNPPDDDFSESFHDDNADYNDCDDHDGK